MKTLLFLLIDSYQKILSPLMHQLVGQRSFCRYSTTCSTYAKEAIEKHGAFRGSMLAINRFLHCQPFTKPYANI